MNVEAYLMWCSVKISINNPMCNMFSGQDIHFLSAWIYSFFTSSTQIAKIIRSYYVSVPIITSCDLSNCQGWLYQMKSEKRGSVLLWIQKLQSLKIFCEIVLGSKIRILNIIYYILSSPTMKMNIVRDSKIIKLFHLFVLF